VVREICAAVHGRSRGDHGARGTAHGLLPADSCEDACASQPVRRYSATGLGSPEGWHRFCACDATGTEPRFRVFEGDKAAAWQFVVSANLMRRHLDTGERAMVAGKFANMPHGTNQHTTGGGANLPILTEAIGSDQIKRQNCRLK
jgi:hypothetical protein